MNRKALTESESAVKNTRKHHHKVLFMIRGGGQVPNMAKFKMGNPPISFYFH